MQGFGSFSTSSSILTTVSLAPTALVVRGARLVGTSDRGAKVTDAVSAY